MAGGLLNLVAAGTQKILIFGNPQKTYWTSTYKHITNFGLQNFRVDYSGLRQLALSTPTSFVFKIKRYADLLTDTVLCVNLPDIYSPFYEGNTSTPYAFKWIENIGAMIIQSIRFTIGGMLVQEMTGYDILAYANRDLMGGQKDKWDAMTGNTVNLYDPAYAYDRTGQYPNAVWSADGTEPSIRAQQLRIPIPIWWGLNSQQAFPLISLQYNELQIEVILRPIQELYVIYDITNPNSILVPYYKAPNMVVQAEQLFNFIQPPPPPENNVYQQGLNSWNDGIYISQTYVFLSTEEQRVFASQQQHYLIREFRHTWYYEISTTDKVWLQNSSGLVLDWTFLFQRSDVQNRNQWSNFTNWPYNHLPNNVQAYDASNTSLDVWVSGPLRPDNIKDIPLSIGILLDGTYREESRPAPMFGKDQFFLTCNGRANVSLPGMYGYNFCLNTSPFTLQPSGAMDMTIYSKIEIEVTTIPPPLNPEASYLVVCDPINGVQIGVQKSNLQLYIYTFNLLVLEERYNVLTFVGGNAALMNAR